MEPNSIRATRELQDQTKIQTPLNDLLFSLLDAQLAMDSRICTPLVFLVVGQPIST